jgi:hypothetical protein
MTETTTIRNGIDVEQLAELCEYVQSTSPVRDVLANAVPVVTSLEVV